MSLLADPIVVGLVVGLPTSTFGVLASRRAAKLDGAAARAAAIATQGDAVQRVIDGLDRLIVNLRTDNTEARELAGDLARRLKDCHEAYDRLKRVTHTQYDEGEGWEPPPVPKE